MCRACGELPAGTSGALRRLRLCQDCGTTCRRCGQAGHWAPTPAGAPAPFAFVHDDTGREACRRTVPGQDRIGDAEAEAYRHEMFGNCSQDPTRCQHCADDQRRRATETSPKPPSGENMTDTATAPTATGDVHDVESALHECELLTDDLGRIDAALDSIDEAITNAAEAAERIEAFLASKNVDNSAVGGMASARDHLSPDRIKELMDAVDAAKQGVKDAVTELQRLQELEQQLAGADGSVLTGS
jgi:hypothetical protein